MKVNVMTERSSLMLSICIPTFNRATFIGQALESIIPQATSECEIVVSDNGSTDDTEQVVANYARNFERLRYVKQKCNTGSDRNFDHTIGLARGKYCWLFSDDDAMKPGAIATVLRALEKNYSLVLVNGEHRDLTMKIVRVPNFFSMVGDRAYTSGELDRLFRDVGRCLICACCIVIKKAIWMARERERYYGSWLVHVAVILQADIEGEVLVIAKPWICLRTDNHQEHTPEAFKIWCINWPSLVWSSVVSDVTKRSVCSRDPWKRFGFLIALRAQRAYSPAVYRRFIRPTLISYREVVVPKLVAYVPPSVARLLYAIYSRTVGWPSSPSEASATMFPKSLMDFVRESPPT